MPEDWQDLDLVAPPVLYRDSKMRDIVAFGGKDGYVTGVDRDTHKLVFRTPVTTIVQAPKNPTTARLQVLPGLRGRRGVEWAGARSSEQPADHRRGRCVLHGEARNHAVQSR